MAADMLFANLSEYNYPPMTTILLRQARQSLISPTHKVLKVLKVLRLSECDDTASVYHLIRETSEPLVPLAPYNH